jgi:hypothetical protein
MQIKRESFRLVLMVTATALTWSCVGSGDGRQAVSAPAEVTRAEREQLALTVESLASCEDAANSLRQAAEDDVNARLDEALRSFLTADPTGCDRVAKDTEAAPSYDSRHIVAGPDDADSIKTDHAYIYKLEGDWSRGSALRIFALQPAEQTKQIAQVDVPGTPSKLFVLGDRALIYSEVSRAIASCAGCVPVGGVTALLLYDLSDRNAPALLRRLDVRGDLQAARQVGNHVYSVISAAPIELGLAYALRELDACFPPSPRPDDQSVVQAFEQLRAQNLAQVRAMDFASALALPHGNAEVGACKLYRAQDRGTSLTSMLTFDLSGDAPASLINIQSQRSVAYLSEQALYLAVDQVHTLHAHASAVHAFSLSPQAADVVYRGSGLVKGRVVDAASMDERQDQLRIATTTDYVYAHPDAQNLLSVLALRDGRLQLVGQLADIVPGLDLRSVRFEGEHAFVTTFARAHSLYAFDLHDPEQPTMLGELANAGYSTYQHKLDERHVLSLGPGGDGQGQHFDRLVLQISDLSDLEHQAPAFRYELPLPVPGDLSGAAMYAMTTQLANNRLALPVSLCAPIAGTHFHFDLRFSGVIVYGVDVASGFRELGRIANYQASAEDAARVCDDWNGITGTEVRRTLLVDDYVYAFTPTQLHVQDVRALGSDVATVAMPAP